MRSPTPTEVRASDANLRSQEFSRYMRHVIEGGGDILLALSNAKNSRAPERVVQILKAAVQAGSTIPADDWGDSIVPHRQIADAYLASLQQMSIFDAALGGMISVPLEPPTSAAVVTAAVVGEVVGERAPRAISAASFVATPLEQLEASAICVVSDELVRNAKTLQGILDGELKLALSVAMNNYFISIIRPAGSPDPAIASAGNTAADVAEDLRAAFDLIDVDALSRLVIGVPSLLAVRLALLDDTAGHLAFPQMTPQGGTIANVRVVPTDALGDDEVIVFDAHAFAGNGGDLLIDSTNQSTIQFDNDPTAPPDLNTVMQTLWQTGRRALRLRRRFGFQQLRTRSVARISSVSWGAAA